MSINPTQQNVMAVSSNNKKYYIDFYQRDYQWKTDQMERLLEDLFYRFGLEYDPEVDPTEENISNFDWYYLNAYVTNDYKGKTFIVDGQQRLTSLTLILINLYHISQKLESPRDELIKGQIMGQSLQGRTYWMGQDNREEIFEDLFNHDRRTIEIDIENISVANLYGNYEAAKNNLTKFLINDHKFESFLIYFLKNVMLVQIQIQNTEDVPMVFEVINDRGVRLKPYEVLKGKLLGQIPKEDIDSYHSVWQQHVHSLQKIDERQVDVFFRFYFRSRYVDTRAEYREFDRDYHKTIYEEKWDDKIQLKQNPLGVKTFVKLDFNYYADLYKRMLDESKKEKRQPSHLYFNNLNNQDRQFLLIMSACKTNDKFESQKVSMVSQLFDRHFTLLQLTGSYDTNRFTESLTKLNKNLRGKNLGQIIDVYNKQLLEDVSYGLDVEVTDPLDWRYFKDANIRNMGSRFLKYYLSRIEHFIALSLQKSPIAYEKLVLKSGWKYGYHIEHILAHNEANLELFDNDEEVFYTERNRLGAILLLMGRDNMASKNEPYHKKLKTYSHTSLFWNESLTTNFYHKHPSLKELMRDFGLQFKAIEKFDRDAIEQRQKLLLQITRLIWPPVTVEDFGQMGET